MANMVIPILLFIFIFGAVAGYINETGLYSAVYTLPTDNMSVSQGTVTEMQESAEKMASSDQAASGWIYIDWIVLGLKSVGAGLLAVFTLGPLLQSFGIPVGMAGMFVSPLGFIGMMYIIGYITGRETE